MISELICLYTFIFYIGCNSKGSLRGCITTNSRLPTESSARNFHKVSKFNYCIKLHFKISRIMPIKLFLRYHLIIFMYDMSKW